MSARRMTDIGAGSRETTVRVGSGMRRVRSLVNKEVRQIARDPPVDLPRLERVAAAGEHRCDAQRDVHVARVLEQQAPVEADRAAVATAVARVVCFAEQLVVAAQRRSFGREQTVGGHRSTLRMAASIAAFEPSGSAPAAAAMVTTLTAFE